MSASLELLPSPQDRLDPIAAAVRWWTAGLAALFAQRPSVVIAASALETSVRTRLPASVSIALLPEDIFVSRAALPPGSPEAHRKALALRLADLAPLDPAALDVAIRRVTGESASGRAEGTTEYLIAMARAERLAALEDKARRSGARAVRFQAEDAGVWLQTRRSRKKLQRDQLADMALFAAAAVAVIIAASVSTRALESQTEALLAADQSARRAGVESERAARDAALANDLVARGVLRRRAGEALADLAALNAVTPEGAWWTRVRWTPEGVTLAGSGTEAAAAIEALSANAVDWSVALAGPVRAGDAGGVQTFELSAAKREGVDGE